MKKIILIYSGGLDSTVMLYRLKELGHEVKALGINYGQRHKKELSAAKLICKNLKVEYRIADLSCLTPFLAGSSQTQKNIKVPEGHYQAENMKLTVVPNRNMLMLSVAASWAISSKFDFVAYAAHSGDHAIYPDCRPEFARAMDRAIGMADWHKVRLIRPFVDLTKAQIVALGSRMNVPFAFTWSCYKGGRAHCGKCGTCVERKESFERAGVEDPTVYL